MRNINKKSIHICADFTLRTRCESKQLDIFSDSKDQFLFQIKIIMFILLSMYESKYQFISLKNNKSVFLLMFGRKKVFLTFLILFVCL
jgi:hypothetical protein